MSQDSRSPNVGNPVQERVRELIGQDPVGGWDNAWKEKVTPWDAGTVQPPLRDLIQSSKLPLPKSGRALVPGCGRGYDAIFLASSLGLSVLAVDISQTAVDAAKEHLSNSEAVTGGSVAFELKNFFTLGLTDGERFDLVYDYTFFVAIPPKLRKDWGRQMATLVKPGGYLITLIFPLDPPQDVGPPYFVRPEHYVEVLGDGWERVLDEVPEISSATHVNRERLVVWKKL